jgi:hypothetical protein
MLTFFYDVLSCADTDLAMNISPVQGAITDVVYKNTRSSPIKSEQEHAIEANRW